ncbi:MAG TPA: STAS domain-containing protein [Solirubrobacteraceae bacterium]|jgi:ABC-type transporter Mla MlaB component|nr:STAS domain-containing protein [Solirubrobacteraceae bacterium]
MPSAPRRVTLEISGPLVRADLPALYDRTCALLEGARPEVLCCELRAVEADAVAVDALARLALAARRHGAHVLLGGASPELRDLVALMGLAEVLVAVV